MEETVTAKEIAIQRTATQLTNTINVSHTPHPATHMTPGEDTIPEMYMKVMDHEEATILEVDMILVVDTILKEVVTIHIVEAAVMRIVMVVETHSTTETVQVKATIAMDLTPTDTETTIILMMTLTGKSC